ncbi:tetratricopeptide repeat-containing sulfotransferase family protein [Altericroceibacterium endophyticum]|uniref:Sulfotransferase n=1 Tax=Altericroceibacterium endophyticum TaxID=1808508 RepID=A0A6I4T6F6_9SPHN|nr:sulfotransferase [Altericroceibacterium endophyticum]MXO65583.1 hypothetical protein [Altericroceibacterium endophyticum]
MMKQSAPTQRRIAFFVDKLKRKDRKGVRQAVVAMVEAEDALGRQWQSIAQAMLNDGEFELARRAAELLRGQLGGDEASFLAASILAKAGYLERAGAIIGSIPITVPTIAENAYFRGTLALDSGDLDAARQHLRRCLAERPETGEAWLALAMAGGVSDAERMRLEQIRARTVQRGQDHSPALLAALGRIYEQNEDHDAAFIAYRDAGRALSEKRAYDPERDKADVRKLIADWRGQKQTETATATQDAPIFVTGLPRSGTTLVEQILASHPAVAGGGEMELLPQMARIMGGKAPADISAFTARGGSLAQVAGEYQRMAQERFGDGRIVDKSLSTPRMVGLAITLFPQARFIWLRRNLEDCAWSAFRSHFARGLAWSQDLGSIGTHFALEEALFAMWKDVLGERMMVVDYGELVDQPERLIPDIANHCGLDFDPAMLTPHRTERVVTTTSAAQVRQPINRKGLQVARPYRDRMEPFHRQFDAEMQALSV